MKATAGAENPNYVLFWTNEDLLSLFAKSLSSDSEVDGLLPLPPSSTIILEFTLDGSNNLNVNGFINDQAVKLNDCANQTTCLASAFATSLSQGIKVPDTATFCKTTSK